MVAGFGFRKEADVSSLRAALALALAQQDHRAVTLLATAQDKGAALEALAEALGLPWIGLGGQALATIPTRTRSAASLRARGVGSLAEACALAAAGPGARLLGPRHISPDRMATCVLAEGFIS